jgi:hypothetical protein
MILSSKFKVLPLSQKECRSKIVLSQTTLTLIKNIEKTTPSVLEVILEFGQDLSKTLGI